MLPCLWLSAALALPCASTPHAVRGIDGAGGDGVDPHLRPPLLGHGLSQVDQRRFARPVGRVAGAGAQARHRGDVDDGPPALPLHDRHHSPAAQEGRLDVEAEGLLQVLLRDLKEGTDVEALAPAAARVVGQDVNAAEGVHGLLHHGRHAVRHPDVRRHSDAPAPHLADLLHHGLDGRVGPLAAAAAHGLRQPGHCHDVGSRPGHLQGDASADPLRGSRDDGDSAAQIKAGHTRYLPLSLPRPQARSAGAAPGRG